MAGQQKGEEMVVVCEGNLLVCVKEKGDGCALRQYGLLGKEAEGFRRVAAGLRVEVGQPWEKG